MAYNTHQGPNSYHGHNLHYLDADLKQNSDICDWFPVRLGNGATFLEVIASTSPHSVVAIYTQFDNFARFEIFFM